MMAPFTKEPARKTATSMRLPGPIARAGVAWAIRSSENSLTASKMCPIILNPDQDGSL